MLPYNSKDFTAIDCIIPICIHRDANWYKAAGTDARKFLKKLGFPVFQKLWRKAFDVNRTQFGIKCYPHQMIGRLRGELIQKTTASALVDCGGVGYICSISLTTYGLLPDEGCEVILYVETLLRENDLSLLGFASTQERSLHRLLVKVDGIGPKLALAALGAVSIEELISAIRGRDIKMLTRIPGVGKKTAEKICFELSEKLGGLTGLDGLSGDTTPVNSWESDLRSALTNLGFKEDAVIPLIAQFKHDKPPLSDAIRICLKALHGNK